MIRGCLQSNEIFHLFDTFLTDYHVRWSHSRGLKPLPPLKKSAPARQKITGKEREGERVDGGRKQ